MANAWVRSPNTKLDALKDLEIKKIGNAILIPWAPGHTIVLLQITKPPVPLYANAGDFQNPGIATVSISPQPLPGIKEAYPYERMDHADITYLPKGNAKLPPDDDNGGGNETETSKKKQGSKRD